MSLAMNWRAAALGLLLVAGGAFAADGAPAKAASGHASIRAPGRAAIASANFHATEAGLEVLARGGNAFDAAVAVAATLSIVEPESSGIGGGFMAVLHRASDGHNVFIDARETAPAAVDAVELLGDGFGGGFVGHGSTITARPCWSCRQRSTSRRRPS